MVFFDETPENFLGYWRVNTFKSLDEFIGLFRREVAMVFVYLYAQDEFVLVSLRVKLDGINIVLDAEHLNRTSLRGRK